MKKIFLAILTVFVLNVGFSQNWDINTLKNINLNRNVKLDPTMKFLSQSTPEVCIAVPLSIITYSLIKKDSSNFRKSMVIGASLATATAITLILKHAVNRQRPYISYDFLDPLTTEKTASFPSAHTSNSFSLATSLSLEYPKWYVIVPSYMWASSVAYSRMHLGVHYPSDVFAGAIVGAGSAFISYKLNKLLGNRKLAQKLF